MNTRWSSQLVEELLFRQYIKGEDVSMLIPPPPALLADTFVEKYDQSTKMLFSYVRNGPTAALASQNVNTVSRLNGATPVKGQQSFSSAPNASQSTTVTAADLKSQACYSPAGKEAAATTAEPHVLAALSNTSTQRGNFSPSIQVRRTKVEWPLSVPTNASLKSSSRSKVAHLTTKRVAAQENVDPDLIFAQNNGGLPLHIIFANYPKALECLSSVRSASGDWRNDTFTAEEEAQYKEELGFVHLGPSQCVHNRSNILHK